MIVDSIVDQVVIYSDGRVRVEGLLDGGEASQFELGLSSTPTGLLLRYVWPTFR
jgi:hypothetical protein